MLSGLLRLAQVRRPHVIFYHRLSMKYFPGKTLAFLLPLFRHIADQDPLEEGDGPIAIIMTPTRWRSTSLLSCNVTSSLSSHQGTVLANRKGVQKVHQSRGRGQGGLCLRSVLMTSRMYCYIPPIFAEHPNTRRHRYL